MGTKQYYKILGETLVGNIPAKIAKVELPRISSKKRSEILHSILEETGAAGMIEPWRKGSILYKPKFEFHILLLFDRPATNLSGLPNGDITHNGVNPENPQNE